MAAYFSYLPNIYVAEGIEDDEQYKYRLVKNIFRRVKAKESLKEYITLNEPIEIEQGDTPASLAKEFYGSEYFDWVILIANDIIDFYEDWPKSELDLQEYTKEKYGTTGGIHHYETKELKFNDEVSFLLAFK